MLLAEWVFAWDILRVGGEDIAGSDRGYWVREDQEWGTGEGSEQWGGETGRGGEEHWDVQEDDWEQWGGGENDREGYKRGGGD